MQKSSGQILVLVLFIIVVFAAATVIVASLSARELEMQEIGEKSLKAQYASEAGWERAKYYIKINSPISSPVTLNGNLDNGYTYTVTITPNGQTRPDGSTCTAGPGNYCIDSSGASP
jgi:flagellar basal body-associated protein FliL